MSTYTVTVRSESPDVHPDNLVRLLASHGWTTISSVDFVAPEPEPQDDDATDEPFTEMEGLAFSMHEVHQAFVNAGFTPNQALHLVSVQMRIAAEMGDE